MKLSVWLQLTLCFMHIHFTWQYCYFLKFLNIRVKDTPNYGLKVHMYNNNTMSSVTYVRKEVPLPFWHLMIVQHQRERKNTGKIEPPKVLYNSTYKQCEFWRYVKRIRVFNNVAQLLFAKDGGNMSLACPLHVGNYMMNNIHVPPDTGILKFMYWPNTLYSMFGSIYSLNVKDNNVKTLLCHYEINATISKNC